MTPRVDSTIAGGSAVHVVLGTAWITVLALPNLLALPVWPWAQVRAIASRESLAELLILDGSLQAALVSVGVSLLVLALVRRLDWLAWITLPFMLLVPAESWHVLEYGHATGAHILGVVAETNATEAMEFLSRTLLYLLVATLLMAVAATLFIRYTRRRRVRWIHRSRVLFLVVVIGTAVAVGLRALIGGDARAMLDPSREAVAGIESRPSDLANRVADVYPWGVPIRLADYAAQRQTVASAARELEGFRFGSTAVDEARPLTVVLVLGESLRADRLSLNGYRRETTPQLGGIADLINFPNAVATTPTTRTSIPHMLTRYRPGTERADRTIKERSLVSAFREAGFASWWISNQMTVGDHDNAIAVLASEADTRRYLNVSSFGARSRHDEVLIPPFREVLSSPLPRRFVVLHMLGSHFNYRSRYPEEYDRFQPSLRAGEPVTPYDRHNKERIRNAYDNSVLYTDHVIASLIRTLQGSGGDSALMFVSDHGQALFDGMCTNSGHGYLSATNFHVPLMIWMSESLRARRTEVAEALSGNRMKPVTTEAVFPTLLALGSIQFDGDKRELSLTNTWLASKPRWVAAGARKWLDYDLELPAKDCALSGRKAESGQRSD